MVSWMFLRELGEIILKAANIWIVEGLGGGVIGWSEEDEGSEVLSVEEMICNKALSGMSSSPASRRDWRRTLAAEIKRLALIFFGIQQRGDIRSRRERKRVIASCSSRVIGHCWRWKKGFCWGEFEKMQPGCLAWDWGKGRKQENILLPLTT